MSRRHTLLLCSGLAAMAGLAAADVERPCIGAGHGVEQWGVVPANGIQLWLAGYGTVVSDMPAPGFPSTNAFLNSCGGAPEDSPILQSLNNAAEAWNNASVPGTGQTAHTFMIRGTNPFRNMNYPPQGPTQTAGYPVSTMLAGGAEDVITFWEPEGTFVAAGSLTLAISFVQANGSGVINGCDIAFNVTSSVGSTGQPLYRFIEENVTLGTTIVTKSFDEYYYGATPATDEPSLAWVDIEGVLVHEFGHLAGLGHSLIESSTNMGGSLTPTMYPVAQATTFTGPVTMTLQGCTGNTQTTVNAAGTPVGGLLGLTARDLTPDDVSAIAAAYPPASAPGVGSIVGTVRDASLASVRGAHVVAISATDPNGNRVGSFSLDTSAFEIGSLAPGDYYVMVEWPDANRFFNGVQMPEIADPTLGSCNFVGFPSAFRTEFWNGAGESGAEALPLEATLVTVPAGGASTTSVDFIVEPVGGLRMLAAACTGNGAICSTASERGAVHGDLAAANASVRLTLTGGTPVPTGAQATTIAVLSIGNDRAATAFPGTAQLLTADSSSGGVFNATFDNTGTMVWDVPVYPSNIGQTFYAQGAEYDAVLDTWTLANEVALVLNAQ